jgi:hypothetical protein
MPFSFSFAPFEFIWHFGGSGTFTFAPFSLFNSFGPAGGGASVVGYIALVIGLWFMLEKAGIPGWGALIPIYNVYLMFRLARINGIWMVLLVVPFANLVMLIVLAFRLSDTYGHGFFVGFFGVFLFPPLGFLIMGLDRSEYRRPRPEIEPDRGATAV